MEQVLLSIIITVVGGPIYLRKCLHALRFQIGGRNIEIIVPYPAWGEELQSLRCEFTEVIFIEIPKPPSITQSNIHYTQHEIFDRGKSLGLAYSQGRLVALLDDQGVPAPDWCERVLETDQLPHAAVGGAIEHSGKNLLNWAVYFTDFGRYQLPLEEGPTNYLSDINICYKRNALNAVRDTWINKYNEVAVNWRLLEVGSILWRRPQMVVHLDRGNLHFTELVRERYAWGRIFGSIRSVDLSPLSYLVYILLTPIIPLRVFLRSMIKVFSSRRNRKNFILSSPVTLFMAYIWGWGECLGVLLGI
jgi:hypothetical protein